MQIMTSLQAEFKNFLKNRPIQILGIPHLAVILSIFQINSPTSLSRSIFYTFSRFRMYKLHYAQSLRVSLDWLMA